MIESFFKFDAIFKLIKFPRQINKLLSQWRIQDFPDGEAPTAQRGAPTYDLAKFLRKIE